MENLEEIFCGVFPSRAHNYAHLHIALDAIFLRVFKEALSVLSTFRDFSVTEHARVHIFRLYVEKLLKIETAKSRLFIFSVYTQVFENRDAL